MINTFQFISLGWRCWRTGLHGYSMLQQYVLQISIHLWDDGFRFHKALVIRVYPCNPCFHRGF